MKTMEEYISDVKNAISGVDDEATREALYQMLWFVTALAARVDVPNNVVPLRED